MKQILNYTVGLAGALALAFSLGRGTAPSPALADSPTPGVASPSAPSGSQNKLFFTYQGQLRKNGAPVNASCSATFKLFDAATGGSQLGASVVSATLQVANGLFTIPLDFGWFMNGEARWIESSIGCGEAATTLTPRTLLSPAPYAFALPGMRTLPAAPEGANPTINVIGGVVGVTGTNTATASSYNSVIGGGVSNTIGYEGLFDSSFSPYSVIAGGHLNSTVARETVIGGGARNQIVEGFLADASRTVIGGGEANLVESSAAAVIAGGRNNVLKSSQGGSIGGGEGNLLNEFSPGAAIGGGTGNTVGMFSDYGTISGGNANTLSRDNDNGTIGGGTGNVITRSAKNATIPGGAGALADLYGQQAYASGQFTYTGDAQASLFVLRGVSFNGQTTTLTLDGDTEILKMANKRSLMASILVVARNSNVSNAGYAGNVLLDRSGSTIYINGSTANPTQLAPVFEDVIAWSCWVKADNPQFAALIQCAGSAGSTVRFVASVRTAEVQWENGSTPLACRQAEDKGCEAKP